MRHPACFILLALAGCTHWAGSGPSVEAALAPEPKHRELVRLILQDGQRVVLYRPELRGDSLFGLPSAKGKEFDGPRGELRTGYPLAGIRRLEIRRFDPLGTAAGVSVVLVAGALIAVRAEGGSINFGCGLLGEPCPKD